MTQEKKLTKTQKLRLKKLAHQIKGLPEDQKKKCMDLLGAYERWYDYAAGLTPGTKECDYSLWERDMYQKYLQYALHYALTGDVLSRAGAVVLSKTASPEKSAHLDKRNKELAEIYNAIDIFGQASEGERESFKKKLKSAPSPRLVSKKQVEPQSCDQKIKD